MSLSGAARIRFNIERPGPLRARCRGLAMEPGSLAGIVTVMAQAHLEAAASHDRPYTLLVVDDEVLIRMSIADHLRDCGFHVIEAASGAEALRVLEAGEAVDLVFTDVQMPGEPDGFALARWVRREKPGVPVLLTSGYSRSADLARDLCTEIVGKPYDHDDLVRRLRALLAQG